MKAVILAGGLGTRLSEETSSRPKPMVEIGGKPILWHIMKMVPKLSVKLKFTQTLLFPETTYHFQFLSMLQHKHIAPILC